MNFCFHLHHHILIIESLNVCCLPLHCHKTGPSQILEHQGVFLLDILQEEKVTSYMTLKPNPRLFPEMYSFRNLFFLSSKAKNKIIIPLYQYSFLILWILLILLTYVQSSANTIPPLIRECHLHMLILLLEFPLEVENLLNICKIIIVTQLILIFFSAYGYLQRLNSSSEHM